MIKKATVDAKEFSDALDRVCGTLRRSSVLPMLSEALVRFSGSTCTLTATDLNTWLITELPADDSGDFSFIFQKTREVAKACRMFDGELTLELNDTGGEKARRLTLCMRCGSRAAEFEAMAPEDYPERTPIGADTFFTVNAAALLKRVERVGYAAGKDPKTRPSICGVQFSGDHVYALDGCRLACDTDESMTVPRPFIAAKDALASLKMFGDREISIELGKRWGCAGDGMTRVYFRLIEGDLFDVSSLPRHEYRESFYVDTRDLLRELKYLKGFTANERKPYVRFQEGGLFMPTTTGKYATNVDIAGTCDTVFAFDLRCMLDALEQFKTEPGVRIKVKSPVAPFIIEADGRSDFALVCPVRLSGKLMAA